MLSALLRFLGRRSGSGLPPTAYASTIAALPVEQSPWLSEARGHFALIPRELIILRPKLPYLAWLRTLPDYDDPESGLGGAHDTMASVRQQDSTAFLLPVHMNQDEVLRTVQEFHGRFFAQMLEMVTQDPTEWPERRTWGMFKQWFDIEHSNGTMDIADLLPDPLEED